MARNNSEDTYNDSVIQSDEGICLDTDPVNQPSGTTRFALNVVDKSIHGDQKSKSNENSNIAITQFTAGFSPIGDVYLGDNSTAVLLTNPNTGTDEIGIIDKSDKYTAIVNTKILGLSIANQCDIRFRIRRGKQRVIYWTDGLNNARSFNFDKLSDYYSVAYQNYLDLGGDPSIYTGEKWDASSFNLQKSYSSIPQFGSISILENGSILPGSYNFAIQYVDEDSNPTAWANVSNPINIYNDTTNNIYAKIRGSKNIQTDAQNFSRTNKSITVSVSNLDQSFPYFRVAIIRAAGVTGSPEKVLLSDLYPTASNNFTYSGNDSELTEGSLSDILLENAIIFAPKHIEQLENRLILANCKAKNVNYCDLQAYASKIKSDLIYQQTILNSVDSQSNVKNENSTYKLIGYMPGEVQSFGVVWIFDDYTLSPVCHIPGKSSDPAETSLMKVYELDTNYINTHNCSKQGFWGVDHLGNTLVGKPVRHHRFPFRHEVNQPLVTSTGGSTNITKYRLKLTITLNPAWTPGPIAYPNDGGTPPTDLVIGYTFDYQIHGAGSTTNYSGELVDTDIGVEFTVYDDTAPLDYITGTQYEKIDPTCELYTYNPGTGNDRFIVTEVYESYVASTAYNSDVANIFGIEFSNIQRPRTDIIGFYIVRNERKSSDKLIIDNAIFGPNTTFQQAGSDVYTSFGLIMPKQYYTANNCGTVGNSGKTVTYSNKSLWFFNPEFQYFGNKNPFDSVVIEGKYTESSIDMPTISDVDGSACNSGKSKGVYINDVQAGTTYDPSVNKKKNKDDDGFDLIIGYRNTNVDFTLDDGTTILPAKSKDIYLNAASSYTKDSNTLYNVSVDNKIGMYLSDSTYDPTSLTNIGGKNALYYGSLVKNNTTAYSDFMTRPYYKEHNNPVLFGTSDTINGLDIFNGDAEISAMNFVSSVFYDIVVAHRPKKSGLWKIIVGGVLAVAGLVSEILVPGNPLGLLAISYGVSLAVSGIKFDQFKNMIDANYDLGLRDTVTDGGVYECIRREIETEDDTIRWFADRVSNIYIESSVPFGLRSGITAGITDFTDAPQDYDEAGFRTYLTEKLTTLDRNQGSGRLYRGYASAEFYDMNPDYMRFNHEKEYFHLPLTYDCCTDPNLEYSLRRFFSQQSFQEEATDNYRVFLPNNYSDMEGEHGEITNMYRLGNNLFMQTKESLWQQPANLQERVTSEIVTFIGTGDFLAIPPRKVIDDKLGSPGTKHKWATVKTPLGVFIVDEVEHKVFLHGEKVQEISAQGVESEFKNILVANLSTQLYNKLGVDFINDNNPANINGIGYTATYDKKLNRVILTKKDYLVVSSKISTLSLVSTIPTINNGFVYCTQDSNFYDGTTLISLVNSDYFENKSFTISYSLNNKKYPWTSWHSYIPNYYIANQDSLYSYIVGNDSLWKHHLEGNFHIFYGVNTQMVIELVKTNILEDKGLEDISIQCKAKIWDVTNKLFLDSRYIFFNRILIYNSRQSTGILNIIVKETQANPANWYQQQITNAVPQEILATRIGRNWNLNDFKDYIVDYDSAMFTKDWNTLKSEYFIDKVINASIIDYNKSWSDLENFTDKYVIIRLIFDNFNNVNMILDYTLNKEQITV